LGVKQKSISGDWMSVHSQEATFTTRVEGRQGIRLGIEYVFLPWGG
jgi:hypothetical protein